MAAASARLAADALRAEGDPGRPPTALLDRDPYDRGGWLTALPGRSVAIGVLACFGIAAAVSVWLGQDANYDLVNYHLYNGWALLHGRLGRDLLPAGMQSTFNPVLDVPYAWLALGPLAHAPRSLAALMGCWAGAAAFAAWRLAVRLHPGQPVVAVLATILAVTGVGLVGEIGTTFNDIPIATLLLCGLLAMTGQRADRLRPLLLAGLLFGAAAGFKLTAAAFAPAGCVAAACNGPPGRMPRAALVFTAGWLTGWVVTDGWWALMLWHRFDSPVFPLFNALFRSPWYPPANFVDRRFLPSGVLQAAAYPFYWFFVKPTAVSEWVQRDPRMALALLLGLLMGGMAIVRRQRAPVPRSVMLFWITGYAIWVASSGILRYALVLEVLAGLCLPLLVSRLLPRRASLAAMAALAVGVAFTTRYAPAARVPYERTVLRADTAWVRPGTLVVLTLRVPSAHIVPLMPFARQATVLGLDFAVLDARGWRLHDEALRMVADHDGPIVAVTAAAPDGRYPELGEIGLDTAVTDCRPVTSTFVRPGPQLLYTCDAHRVTPAVMPSAFWHQASLRYRTVVQLQHGTGPLIGAAYLRAAGPGARGTRFLDWTDLLWNGVGQPHDVPPPMLDAGTLYVLSPDFVAAMTGRMDPTRDAIGAVDGWIVLAPGWQHCAACTATIGRLADGF